MSEYLTVQIKTHTLVKLIEQGVLSGADLHCTEVATKELIQEVCLKACIQKICRQCQSHEQCARQTESSDTQRRVNGSAPDAPQIPLESLTVKAKQPDNH